MIGENFMLNLKFERDKTSLKCCDELFLSTSCETKSASDYLLFDT